MKKFFKYFFACPISLLVSGSVAYFYNHLYSDIDFQVGIGVFKYNFYSILFLSCLAPFFTGFIMSAYTKERNLVNLHIFTNWPYTIAFIGSFFYFLFMMIEQFTSSIWSNLLVVIVEIFAIVWFAFLWVVLPFFWMWVAHQLYNYFFSKNRIAGTKPK